jgi:hypothetical protein
MAHAWCARQLGDATTGRLLFSAAALGTLSNGGVHSSLALGLDHLTCLAANEEVRDLVALRLNGIALPLDSYAAIVQVDIEKTGITMPGLPPQEAAAILVQARETGHDIDRALAIVQDNRTRKTDFSNPAII